MSGLKLNPKIDITELKKTTIGVINLVINCVKSTKFQLKSNFKGNITPIKQFKKKEKKNNKYLIIK